MNFQIEYDNLTRLRISFPNFTKSKLVGLLQLCSSLEGVYSVDANYITNSLTIHYEHGYREYLLDTLRDLKVNDIPLGKFHPNMVKKDFLTKSVESYAKKMILSAIFPSFHKVMRKGR